MDGGFLFSVIIAAANAERDIGGTMEAIISQTLPFENFIEIVVVNNGSIDSTGAVARSYATLYPENIRVYDKVAGSAASARNVGLRMAKGSYINFCEQNGRFDPEVFASVAMFFESHKEEVNITAVAGKKPPNVDDFFDFFKRTRVIDLDRTPSYVQTELSTCFIARHCCALLSFDEQLHRFEELEFIYRILSRRPTIGVVEKHGYRSPEVQTDRLTTAKLLLNEFLPKMITFYRERFDPPLPPYFLYFVMRLFCTHFAGNAREFALSTDDKRALLPRIKQILSLLSEKMLRSDMFVQEDALAFCLSMKPNSQEYLKKNYPEFDCCYSVTVIIPPDADAVLTDSLRRCSCEQLEILRTDPASGLARAGGDFVMFFDAHDRVEADIFRVMLRRLILTRASICCCGYYHSSKKIYNPEGLAGIVPLSILCAAPLCLSSFMFKTDLLRTRIAGEKIDTHNPYFFLAVLQKMELVTVNRPLLHTHFSETRSFEEIYGNEKQSVKNPLVQNRNICKKYNPFGN